MILATVAGALGVGAAVGDALCAPLGADGVGERIAILGHIGREAVVADAGVGETVGVAFVGRGGSGGRALVEADEGALGDLLLAPEVSSGIGDGLRVDSVLLLGSSSSREEECSRNGSFVW